MTTVKQEIEQYEAKYNDRAIAIVVGNQPSSVVRQLNKKAIERWGKESGYIAKRLRRVGKDIFAWRLDATINV